MAPPVEGGANGWGGGGRRPNAIKIATGVPIGAQACSPPKPFKQPSLLPAGNGLVPQMSKGSVSSLASGANGSSVLVSALLPPSRVVCVCAQGCGQPSPVLTATPRMPRSAVLRASARSMRAAYVC